MANPEQRGRFVWYELMTKDPAAAQDFYKEVVGWNTGKWDGPTADPGIDYTMWMSDQVPIGGVMNIPADAAAMGAPPSWIAYVEVPDADETAAKATELGGTVLAPPQTVPGVGRFAVLQDPQGATFAVITSESGLPEEHEPQPREFSWHELATTDYKAAEKFYNELFGWDLKDEYDMGPLGVYQTYGRGPFPYGGMYNKPADMPAPPHWLQYVRVDSADAAAERATKAGGQVVNGPMDVPGGGRVAQIIDPQGAAFAVHSRRESAPS